ncbi:hypothetical protein CCP3SC1_1440003 [Gammaproteobacteria bacterium]
MKPARVGCGERSEPHPTRYSPAVMIIAGLHAQFGKVLGSGLATKPILT